MPGGTVHVDHRGGVLVGREGQGVLPVEPVLGGDRLVERGRAGGRVVAFLAPESEPIAHLHGATAQSSGPTGQSGDAGIDQDAIDVDAAQARAETMVADHHHRGAPRSASSQRLPIASSSPRMTSAAAAFHSGFSMPVSSTFKIGPDPVLERVEVLELDHQDGPVVDDAIGEPAALGAAAEAVGGQPGVGLQLVQRLRGPLPEVA